MAEKNDTMREFARAGVREQLRWIAANFPDELARLNSNPSPASAPAKAKGGAQHTRIVNHMKKHWTANRKPHWTQTAAGKAKMAKLQRKAWKTRKARKADVDAAK